MRLRAWWHRKRHVNCGACGREFRKGHGSGASRSVFCSGLCFGRAWADWISGSL